MLDLKSKGFWLDRRSGQSTDLSLDTTLQNKLFVSLSVKVTVYLASDVVIRLICAYYDYFVLSSGVLLFVAYYS